MRRESYVAPNVKEVAVFQCILMVWDGFSMYNVQTVMFRCIYFVFAPCICARGVERVVVFGVWCWWVGGEKIFRSLAQEIVRRRNRSPL